jgi:hypothetical protein
MSETFDLESLDLYLMDPEQVLYSEGCPITYFRGKLHLFACLFIFVCLLYLYYVNVFQPGYLYSKEN